MSKANGTNVIFDLGTTPGLLFGETSSEIQLSTDVFETTTKLSAGRKKTFEAGEHGFTGSAESIVLASDGAKVKALIEAKDLGEAIPFVYASNIVGDFNINGNVLITNINLPAPKNEARTISVEFQGTGTYTIGVNAE